MTSRRLLAAATIVFFSIGTVSMSSASAGEGRHGDSRRASATQSADSGKSSSSSKKRSSKSGEKHKSGKSDKDAMKKEQASATTAAPATAAPTTTAAPAEVTSCDASANGNVVVPIDSNFTGTAGESKVLVANGVSPTAVGATAALTFTADAATTPTAGSNLVIKSGSSTVTLADVSAAAGKVTTDPQALTLGSTLEVSGVANAQGAFAAKGQLTMAVTCATTGQGGPADDKAAPKKHDKKAKPVADKGAACVGTVKLVIPVKADSTGKAGHKKAMKGHKLHSSHAGKKAAVEYKADNDKATSSGSDLMVKTGKTTAKLSDLKVKKDAKIVLGDNVDITVVAGKDGKYGKYAAGKLHVTIECDDKVKATTTTVVHQQATTTTAPANVLDKVEAGDKELAKTGANDTIPMAIAGLSFLLGGISLLSLARTARRAEA